jgi:hypothetical protein
VSSNKPPSRRRSTPPQAPPAQTDEVHYEDDVFYGGDWREEDVHEDDVVDYRAPAPSQGGTAAGLNRLRQSIGRNQPEQQPAPKQRSTRSRTPEAPRYLENEETTLTPKRRPRQASPPAPGQSTRPQRTARNVPAPLDEPIDDFAPYDEYDDDFTEYDAPRRQPRQGPRVAMPSIKRPTMPSALANADLVNDAGALLLIGGSIVSLAAMAILVGNQASSLAPEFATHVSASGLLQNFRGESALWRLPLLAGAFTLMNIAIAWFTAPIDRFASRFMLAAALLVQFIAWIAVIRIL